MTRRFVVSLAIALATLGTGATGARAATSDFDTTCGNTFNICMNFNLALSGSTWTLTTSYVSSPSGALTSTGMYYNANKTAPAYGIGNVTLVSPVAGWQAGTGCTDLNMNNGSTSLLGACGSTTNGINGAVVPVGSVVITFTTSNQALFESDLGAGKLDYRAHVQGYGATSCSIKLDTGAQGDIGSSGSNCVVPGGGGNTDSTVPEPVSMVLLGSGLIGLGGLRFGRRKKDQSAQG